MQSLSRREGQREGLRSNRRGRNPSQTAEAGCSRRRLTARSHSRTLGAGLRDGPLRQGGIHGSRASSARFGHRERRRGRPPRRPEGARTRALRPRCGRARRGAGLGRHRLPRARAGARHRRLADRRAMVAIPLGTGGPGRRLELDHAREDPRRHPAGAHRQGLRDRPRLRGGHAEFRRARLLAAHPRRADRRPVRAQPGDLERRVPGDRDRAGRHPVRRARPYRRRGEGRGQGRDALLQRLHRPRT